MQVAYQNSDVQAAGWMRSGTGQMCVNRTDAFTYERPSGDPAANCGGILIPVAHDFVPDGPGKFTYTIEWYGYASYVAIGKADSHRSSVASTVPPTIPSTIHSAPSFSEHSRSPRGMRRKKRGQRSVRPRRERVECEGPRGARWVGCART